MRHYSPCAFLSEICSVEIRGWGKGPKMWPLSHFLYFCSDPIFHVFYRPQIRCPKRPPTTLIRNMKTSETTGTRWTPEISWTETPVEMMLLGGMIFWFLAGWYHCQILIRSVTLIPLLHFLTSKNKAHWIGILLSSQIIKWREEKLWIL